MKTLIHRKEKEFGKFSIKRRLIMDFIKQWLRSLAREQWWKK